MLDEIRSRFGDRVGDIVEACSDALVENPEEKPEWRERKERYHRHLRASPDASVHLVSVADKLHNAQATAEDLRRIGPLVWERFNAGREASLWNYEKLMDAYKAGPIDSRVRRVLTELRRTVSELA